MIAALLLALEWAAAAAFVVCLVAGVVAEPLFLVAAVILLGAGLFTRHVAATGRRPAGGRR